MMLENPDQYRSYLKLLARLHLGADLRGKVEPSDVVQQTLLRAEAGKKQFRGTTTDDELAWLRSILAHVLSNLRREFHRHKRDIARELPIHQDIDASSARLENLLIADQTSPSLRVERAEQVLLLAQALDSLAEAQREAVARHYLLGQPLSEIAAALNRSTPAVAGLLQRGLKTLRQRLTVSESSHEQT